MWKSFENVGLQTSEKVSWEKKEKETCVKHKIDRSQNGRSNNFFIGSVNVTIRGCGATESRGSVGPHFFEYAAHMRRLTPTCCQLFRLPPPLFVTIRGLW